MEYTTLGDTGMTVSKICLGCMSFGDSDWREWVLDEEAGKEIVERALELGVTFFDTANMYSNGESERVLGEALEGHREETVVATKGYFQMDESNPNSGGLSRKAIEQELDDSLDRLGMDAQLSQEADGVLDHPSLDDATVVDVVDDDSCQVNVIAGRLHA
mgnify:CR=1 FL=1